MSMMKLTFLLALGACALAGNLKAEIKDWCSTKNYPAHQLSSHDEQLRAYVAKLLDEKRQCEILLERVDRIKDAAKLAYVAAAFAKATPEALELTKSNIASAEELIKKINARIEWLTQVINSEANLYADGSHVPEIGDLYDSEPMIKMYLHDSGYNDVSDAQVAKIATYMRANRIHHVSQL